MAITGRVDTWFETKFSDKVTHAFQQEMSKLRDRVMIDPDVPAKTWKAPVLGKSNVTKNKPSHNDQEPETGGHTEPSVTLDDYTTGRYVAYLDQKHTRAPITDAYVKAQAKACGREIDSIILTAIDSETTAGNSNVETSSGGLTYEKVTTGTKFFLFNQVNTYDGDTTLVVDDEGWEDLALETEFKSSDFVHYSVAETGKIPAVQGHMVIVVDPALIPNRDTSLAPSYAYLFHRDAVGLPIGCDMKTNINEIPQKFSDFIGTYFSAAAKTLLTPGTYRLDVGQS